MLRAHLDRHMGFWCWDWDWCQRHEGQYLERNLLGMYTVKSLPKVAHVDSRISCDTQLITRRTRRNWFRRVNRQIRSATEENDNIDFLRWQKWAIGSFSPFLKFEENYVKITRETLKPSWSTGAKSAHYFPKLNQNLCLSYSVGPPPR